MWSPIFCLNPELVHNKVVLTQIVVLLFCQESFHQSFVSFKHCFHQYSSFVWHFVLEFCSRGRLRQRVLFRELVVFSSIVRERRTFPQKTASVPASDRVRQRPVYWWWLCIIMQFSAKNLTPSLSRMFGGSGSQSLHIITRAVTIHVSKLKSWHLDPRTCLALWESRIATQLQALWAVSNTTLTTQQSFTISPLLLVHTGRNATVKTNRCIIQTESWHCGSLRDVMEHVMIMTCVCFLGVSPVSPLSINPDGRGKVHWSLGPEGWPSQRFFFTSETG